MKTLYLVAIIIDDEIDCANVFSDKEKAKAHFREMCQMYVEGVGDQWDNIAQERYKNCQDYFYAGQYGGDDCYNECFVYVQLREVDNMREGL